MAGISVQILTFNEAPNLPRCLDAISWCDDILIVDSGSTDGTLEIARARGCRILERPFDDFANQRNFGLEEGKLRHEWVLHLDADEVVTPALRNEIENLVPPEGIDGYNIPSKLMLNESWLKHSGMYPVFQVRLGHRDRLRFIQYGHGQREGVPASRIGTLNEPYLHYNFSHGLQRWFAKHVRYAKDEADQIRHEEKTGRVSQDGAEAQRATGLRRRLKNLAGRLPPLLRPPARFFYTYILRKGFLDGRAGLQYALMLTAYEAMTAVFLIQGDGDVA